jgi:hypothetical protein
MQRRKELFIIACGATITFAVLGALNLGGIQPFHDQHLGIALLCFALAVIALVGANFTRPAQAMS